MACEEGSCVVGSGTLSEVLCRRRNEKNKIKSSIIPLFQRMGFRLFLGGGEGHSTLFVTL